MQKESVYIAIIMLFTSTLLVLLPVIFIIIFTMIYQKKQLAFFTQLEAMKSANEKELLCSQLEIQERTFEKISQEIHDNIGQEISIAKLYLNTLNINDPKDIAIKSAEASILLTKVMDDVRDLSRHLNSSTIQTSGLTAVIKNNLEQIEKTGRFITSLTIEGEVKFIDESKEFAVFRIFQEAINNIIKHAKANQIWVAMNYRDCSLALVITDNGSGFLADSHFESRSYLSSGLINMQKRAKLIGADFSIDCSKECSGAVIKLLIPYNNDQNSIS